LHDAFIDELRDAYDAEKQLIKALPKLARAATAEPLRAAFLEHLDLSIGMMAGSLVIAALGAYDDLRGTRASQKLAVQVAVASAMYAVGIRIDVVTSPLGGTIPLGWLGFPVTVLWITGVVNAMNLLDGLDGLAGGVAAVAALTTLTVAVANGDLLMAVTSAGMAGATVGFLVYNFSPASVFMGDTGSMFLGFVLAVTSVHTHEKTPTAVALAVPCLALGVPIADTLLAMARRAARGVPIYSADRGHIHHRLLDRGLTQRQAVLVLYACAAALGAGALLLNFRARRAFPVLLTVGAAAFLGLRALGFFRISRAAEVLAERRRAAAVRAGLARAAVSLQAARRPQELRAALHELAVATGAVAVRLGGSPAEVAGAAFEAGFVAESDVTLRERFSVGGPGGVLELGWADGRTAIDRDVRHGVEALRDVLGEVLERLAARARREAGSGHAQRVAAPAPARAPGT